MRRANSPATCSPCSTPTGAFGWRNKAIELDPSPAGAGAYYVRGLVYETKGNHKRAISELTKVIELDPQHAWTYIDRGKIYYERND